MAALRMAQYGTKHGHAAGKLDALRRNALVDFAGIFEADDERRAELQHIGGPYEGVHWFNSADELLSDPSIVAVASEGRNDESLDQTEQIIQAGKHVWYDKPAGEDFAQWQRVVAQAERTRLHIQMGYMFRYHHGFRQIEEWVRTGLLGDVYGIRAHMSTWISEEARQVIARHPGGIFYDLAGHMLDQIVWLLGRPSEVSAFLRDDTGAVPGFKDNTLAVFAYQRALAYIDIAAIETPPTARRFEVYGERGSAIMEPFEPARGLRLCLAQPHEAYSAGEQFIPVENCSRQELYDRELDAFVATLRGEQPPERPYSHDLLVQETLLRASMPVTGK